MGVIIITGLVLVGGYSLFRWSVERGKKFVKAYYFLYVLEVGDTVEEANLVANGMFERWSDPDADKRIAMRAKAYSREQYGGKQLPVIAEARVKGFTG